MKKGLLFVCILCLLLWFVGLLLFAKLVKKPVQDFETKTQAIVVLTGGTQRLEEGLALLKEHKAEKLFISGVNEKVDMTALMKNIEVLPEEITQKISLGHIASNTHGNALETRLWVKENKISSLRLVTASYHMPRSLLEFKNVLPDLTIIPHPIFPQTVKHTEWWKWKGTFYLINSEFFKYLFVSLRNALSFETDTSN